MIYIVRVSGVHLKYTYFVIWQFQKLIHYENNNNMTLWHWKSCNNVLWSSTKFSEKFMRRRNYQNIAFDWIYKIFHWGDSLWNAFSSKNKEYLAEQNVKKKLMYNSWIISIQTNNLSLVWLMTCRGWWTW